MKCLWLRLGLLAVGALLMAAGSIFAEPPRVEVIPVQLDPTEPQRVRLGGVTFRGGLELRSADARFGGLSALSVSGDGTHLTAISDQGHWLEARLTHDGTGRLTGFELLEIGPVRGLDGGLLLGKQNQDAESLAILSDGSVLVGFERQHRLWRFPPAPRALGGRPTPVPTPSGLALAPNNGGLEAMTALADGRVLALAEELVDDGQIRGWVGRDGAWEPLAYRISGRPRPTGAALMPSGDVVVLERSYVPSTGNLIRLKRIAQADIVPGAVLDGPILAELQRPLSVDNFEGVACRAGGDGQSLVYIVSDDNFSSTQRTLLFLFAIVGSSDEETGGAGRVAR
jgi:hypothetical protein